MCFWFHLAQSKALNNSYFWMMFNLVSNKLLSCLISYKSIWFFVLCFFSVFVICVILFCNAFYAFFCLFKKVFHKEFWKILFLIWFETQIAKMVHCCANWAKLFKLISYIYLGGAYQLNDFYCPKYRTTIWNELCF